MKLAAPTVPFSRRRSFWSATRIAGKSNFLSMRKKFVSYFQPIRFARFALSMPRVTGIPCIQDFRCWTFPSSQRSRFSVLNKRSEKKTYKVGKAREKWLRRNCLRMRHERNEPRAYNGLNHYGSVAWRLNWRRVMAICIRASKTDTTSWTNSSDECNSIYTSRNRPI